MTIVRPIHTDSSPLTRGKRHRNLCRWLQDRLIPAHAGKTLEKTLAREPSGAHPRSRGENLIASSSMRHRSGSSPLTRGKPDCLLLDEAQIRLIPAHAGKTSRSSPVMRPAAAHPRSRGENASIGPPRPSGPGSSPLTRGKQTHEISHELEGRLIPAHAGKTTVLAKPVGSSGAHPRSRGENAYILAPGRSPVGSSPLTRGKPGIDGLVNGGGRLIPAHAGKTALFCEVLADRGAHPRSRGENVAGVDWGLSEVGSSPLTRGKQPFSARCSRIAGLIPAHAGKTSLAWTGGCPRWAHPRSRGENTVKGELKFRDEGSSPLTRGKPVIIASKWAAGRLIPAHAGKTSIMRRAASRQRAHPRSRGENVWTTLRATGKPGSSPLTRGKLVVISASHFVNRLIPAHAGKTRRGRRGRGRPWAHPRSRGENVATDRLGQPPVGSSPLTRGKLARSCW